MQYVSGFAAQDYNRRKSREGAFWGDRYHVVLVESGRHLRRCLFYLDMNMVRAGVVTHPEQWECSGYHELAACMGNRSPKKQLLDRPCLLRLLDYAEDDFATWYADNINQLCRCGAFSREPWWTEAAAVGSQAWVEDVALRFPRSWCSTKQVPSQVEGDTWMVGMSNRMKNRMLAMLDKPSQSDRHQPAA